MPKTHAFSFMCSKDVTSEDKKPFGLFELLSFWLLIPNDLMFSGENWQWRITNLRNRDYNSSGFLYRELNLRNRSSPEQEEPTRFKSLLQKSRDVTKELIKLLLEDKHGSI